MSTRGIKYKNIMSSRECRLLNPFEWGSLYEITAAGFVCNISLPFAGPFQISAHHFSMVLAALATTI